MRAHCSSWRIATAGLALGICLLVVPSRDRAADDEKDVRDEVLRIADLIARNDGDGARKRAKTLPADLDPEDVMSVLSPRKRKGGGVGLGPKPGEITPDGIEQKVQVLAEKKRLTQKALDKQAQALERAGYIAAAAALAVQDRPPVRGTKARKDWKKWAGDMHEAARDFAAAAKAKNPARVKNAATKLKDSCIRCHQGFRDLAIAESIQNLKHEDPFIRSNAARSLGLTGSAQDAGVIPHLIQALDDKDKEVRRSAAESLAKLAVGSLRDLGLYKTNFPVVNASLRDADNDIRFWFTFKLKRVPPDTRKLIPVLVEALKHPDDDLRARAADLLGCLGPEAKTAAAALGERLQDASLDVRRAAAGALLRIRADGAIPALVASLGDKDPIMRGRAGVALARMGKTAVPALAEALKGKDRYARAAAVYALGRIGADARPAVPALLDMLKGKDPYLRAVAASALKKIDPKAAAGAGIE